MGKAATAVRSRSRNGPRARLRWVDLGTNPRAALSDERELVDDAGKMLALSVTRLLEAADAGAPRCILSTLADEHALTLERFRAEVARAKRMVTMTGGTR